MRIVCGTDYSPNADAAARAAAALAVRLNEPLALVHVDEHAVAAPDEAAVAEAAASPARQALTRAAERLRAQGAFVTEHLIGSAKPAQALADFARRPSSQLMVVSSVSKSAWDRWTMGTVSEALAESAACPTLVVRGADALVAWAEGRSRLTVMVAMDSSASCEPAVGWIERLQKMGPCNVIAAHIAWPPDERRRFGSGQPGPSSPESAEIRALQAELRRQLDRLLGPNEVRIEVRENWGRPDAALVELARSEHADLVIVGTHQRHGLEEAWHGSISRGVVRHAAMNVLCVPAKAGAAAGPRPRPAFDRVLAATDFSPNGNRAIPFAYAAVAPGGTVHLVHVGPGGSTVGERRALRALIPADAEARGLTTEIEPVQGLEIGPAIAQAAERFGADLICLGVHPRTSLAEFVIGSTARETMKHSHKPVLLVPAPEA